MAEYGGDSDTWSWGKEDMGSSSNFRRAEGQHYSSPSIPRSVEGKSITLVSSNYLNRVQDWQWDGRVHIPGRPRKRESAVIDIMAGDRSTISYNMPMIVTQSGYESAMEVHLDDVVVTSSSNDIRLLCAESARVSIRVRFLRSDLTHSRSELSFRHQSHGMKRGLGGSLFR